MANSKPAADPLRADPTTIFDDTPFPPPELYFKVNDSEVDEPEAKIRSDVNKLYDRWQEKYGRRWPEDGLGTEDMVWLAEEAYKPSAAPASRPRARGKPVEETDYEGEFLPFSDDDAGAAAGAAGGPGSGGARGKDAGAAGAASGSGKRMSNYEKTVAGAKWVTDEFESADYEAGNLEKLWDMYLWDKEGKPTMMPDGPPNPQEGEESEDFDDFYTAYRPRGIDSDDAREAVWATDEFESDEDNTEDEWEPEYVGAGLGLIAEDPLNPQYSLRHTNHPLAPFPGEPLKWASYVYPDLTTYEGLSKQSIPHGMGVMTFGTGTGAGLTMKEVRYGDRYEGEFQGGYAHGLGQFTSEGTGELYIGEFFAGQRHGCGMVFNLKPYYYLLERGMDPVTAYRTSSQQIMGNVEARTWYRGNKLGDADEDKVVMVSVLNEELDNPLRAATRNALHDSKLRSWVAKTSQEKAWDRVLGIIERVTDRKGGPRPGGYYYEDRRGKIKGLLDTEGNDTDYDSMDMLQGVETDGNLGPGWDGATDSSETPMEPRLREQMIAEAMDDKLEDEGYKEAILGQPIVNPFTGLDLKTYLDGKEHHHEDLVAKWMSSREGAKMARAARGGKDTESTSLVEDEAAAGAGGGSSSRSRLDWSDPYLGLARGQLSQPQLQRAEEAWRRWDELLADDEPLLRPRFPYAPAGKNPLAPNDTDTGFETESDMMEMCDMAEIMGTVEEARQIVQRARMWRFKPYGEATIRMAQDGRGQPVNLFQDPLHYPHGTKFMAPGPLGQCHPVPDDPSLRMEMAKVAEQYGQVYEMYNLEWDPAPGTAQYKVDQRIRRALELHNNALARYLEAADGAVAPQPAEGQGDQQLLLAALPEAASSSGRPATHGSAGRLAASQGGSVFASMTFSANGVGSAAVGIGRASRAVLNALSQAAKQVPMARPRLARPSQQQQPRTAAAASMQPRGPLAAVALSAQQLQRQ